ncbi:PAS domain-containing sensor histidine kinase [Aquimarina brevivitae]|uniref:histidine kinase n=1 Tax=Aquimarina brevivitae TaxID=323412 RepID=A0A4Q7NUE8_9FLAO|nr:PAS domain S-box protein [Aquimarina brevivitae]RZS90684.1 PAS domain S-box-containing protein [Aquimarina brevivitae]
MDQINFYQILIFGFQGLIISFLLLLLFQLRATFGVGLLFATMGLFQFMQALLASTLYYEIADGLMISPGSSVMFPATLFAILLIYIKEDATVTRRLIYALITANIVMSVLLLSFRFNIEESFQFNNFNLSSVFFDGNALVLMIGTVALFLDSLLIIFTFEFISKYSTNLFIRICFTMLIALTFDAVFFALSTFWYFDNVGSFLESGLYSKVFSAIFYSIVFSLYLKYVDKEEYKPKFLTFKDTFHALTYKQKFIAAEKAAQLTQSRYKTLTNISPVGIFMTKPNGKTIFVNPRWCEISGMSYEEALGEGWLKAVHPDDRQRLKKGWENDTEDRKASYSEYRFINKKDGSIKWVLGQAIPEYDENGRISGYVGTITDITEIKLYEEELSRLKDKAEESDRLKSAFLANMSHEIRTPMNGIMGFAELLKEPKLSGDEKSLYLSLIEESGKRMLNIIKDIIDISKIESGQVTVTPSDVAINEEITYLYQFFKPEADKKNLELSFHLDLTNENAVIRTDKEKLVAILTNLIKNAIKYTNEGAISFGYQKVNKDKLEFFVKDTGIGIPKNRQKAIFKRFVQADIKDRYALEGAGIGLSIAKAYVEMLEGKIRVESTENIGSTFYFTIPYIKAS